MNQYTEDIQHIRKMMDKSAQFLSLSGLSGIAAGTTALISTVLVFSIFKREGLEYFDGKANNFSGPVIFKLAILAISTLLIAIGSGAFFTINKLKKNKLPLYNSSTRNFLFSLFIPLIAGGVFSVALAYNMHFYMIAPSMLIFYGLALVNASKFTHNEIYWLGIIEIVLGIIASFLTGYGLVFWAIGFGLLHILYGIILHQKYK